jgi:general secretion pathway protein J
VAQHLSQIQTAFLLIQQDMEQILPRGVRDAYGDEEPAVSTMGAAGHPIVFTRGGTRSRFQKKRSALQRIAYKVEDGTLYRLSWPVLDGAEDDAARMMPLLQGVEEMSFQFLGDVWDANWPPYSNQSNSDILPKAVEMRLTLERWGSVRRLFALPQ